MFVILCGICQTLSTAVLTHTFETPNLDWMPLLIKKCTKHFVVHIKPHSTFIHIPPNCHHSISFHPYLEKQKTQLPSWKHAFSPTIPSPKPQINLSPQSETPLYHTPNDLLINSSVEKLELHLIYHVSSSY